MKKTSIFIGIGLALLVCMSCHREIMPTPVVPTCYIGCDTVKSKLEIIWAVPLGADTGDYKSQKPVIWNDKVIFTQDYGIGNWLVKGRDAKNGNLLWTWDDYIPSQYGHEISDWWSAKDKIYFCDWSEMYSISADNGQTNWRYKVPPGLLGGHPRMSVFKNNVFHVRATTSHPNDTITHLVRSDISDGIHWDTLLTAVASDGYTTSFEPPAGWINPQGDTMLVFDEGQYNFDTHKTRINMRAYNLHKKEVVWEKKDYGGGVPFPPLVVGEKVYYQNDAVHCIDLNTGNELWKSPNFYNPSICKLVAANGKIFGNTTVGTLFCIDANTGSLCWSIQASNIYKDIEYYNNMLFFAGTGDGKLYAVNADNGNIIWAEKSPLKKRKNSNYGSFSYMSTTINPVLNCLYVADNHFAMCIKLPK